MYTKICDAFATTLDSIPAPTTYIHKAPFGLKKMLNDFLTKLKLGHMKTLDQYSNYVNKKFHQSDYLTLCTQKHKFKSLELQYRIDAASDPIKEPHHVTLSKFIEDHPCDETFD